MEHVQLPVQQRRPAAERELAQLWVDHPSERNAITAATAALEARLRLDPLALGESRGGVAWRTAGLPELRHWSAALHDVVPGVLDALDAEAESAREPLR